MIDILTLPFYILFFFFMVFAVLQYFSMIIAFIFIGLIVMFLPK